MAESVVVLGGGVAGMTAAQELAERGFAVRVLEHRDIPGGKARSYAAAGTARPGRMGYPAEHGFRFFPGFYKHVPDTMKRIPFGSNPNGVFDNLEPATRAEIARAGKAGVTLAAGFPRSFDDVHLLIHDIFRSGIDIPDDDKAHFADLLVMLLSSCEERRYVEYENESWWTFSGADRRSPAYQKFLADGLTRTLVAARAREMSARTGGYILLQLLIDMAAPGKQVDRVLNGPTSDVWIGPWSRHLEGLGVTYTTNASVTGLQLDGAHVTAVEFEAPGGREVVTPDWVLAALPVEVMTTLLNEQLLAAQPTLVDLARLKTRWMTGIQFYLREDVPLVRGHVIYIDSPWALTSISQAQFWPSVDLARYGDGTVRGILSVDVSEWCRPGLRHGEAMHCTKDEIITEVIAQLESHLDVDGQTAFHPDNIVHVAVDDDIRFDNPHEDVNLEPLLVNTVGSWAWRPDAVTAVDNLFLAGDYVRTYTDLATMEGANEAARRATNGILAASGSSEPRCEIWPLHEPELFAPIRSVDRFRFRHRYGDVGPVGPGPGA